MNRLRLLGPSAFGTLVIAALSAQCSVALSQPTTSSSTPRLASVLGREVTPPKGVEGGRIIDVLIDGEGQVHAFVVEFGGFLGIGTRKIAVERDAFRFADREVLIDVSGEQIQAAREYAVDETPYVVRIESAPRN